MMNAFLAMLLNLLINPKTSPLLKKSTSWLLHASILISVAALAYLAVGK